MNTKRKHQDEEFIKKIDEIEKCRKLQVESLEEELGVLTSNLSKLKWIFLCLGILLFWPVSLLLGSGISTLTFLLLLFLCFKVPPAIEKTWQGEDGKRYRDITIVW